VRHLGQRLLKPLLPEQGVLLVLEFVAEGAVLLVADEPS
jgi:hypothetical protein